MPSTAPAALIQRLAGLYSAWPHVEAVALGGSHSGGLVDPASDIDLYVFTTAEIPLAARETLVRQAGGASRADLGLTYWGPGDEWYDAATGIEVDVVYFEAGWMREQIRRVIDDHQASLGYSTCLWHTGRQAHGLYDPRGWLQALQRDCQAAYPEALRRNIITLNQPVLRTVIPSYFNQIAKAVQRRDWVSVNHRLAALLTSYFDILFAFNRVLHPGENVWRLRRWPAVRGCQPIGRRILTLCFRPLPRNNCSRRSPSFWIDWTNCFRSKRWITDVSAGRDH